MNFSWQNVETKYYLRFMMEKVLRSAMSIKIPFATIINNNCTKGQVACGGNQSAPTPQNEAQNNLADCQSTPFVRRQIFFFSYDFFFIFLEPFFVMQKIWPTQTHTQISSIITQASARRMHQTKIV